MRLDKYLVEKGFIETRSRAVHLIKDGKVSVNGKKVLKQSYNIEEKDNVHLASKFIYVGRGGYKIEELFRKANLNPKDKAILDIGCSIGGFSDFFLQNGASSVFAIDIADNIIHKKLVKNSKLEFYGGVDARDIHKLKNLIKNRKFDIISIDLTNVSLREVIESFSTFLNKEGIIVALFKPHYEGGKGVVSEKKLQELMEHFESWLHNSYTILHIEKSPLRGGPKNKGNTEMFYVINLK